MKEKVNKKLILKRKNPWLKDFESVFIKVHSGVLFVR
jgi:hypothetical protein